MSRNELYTKRIDICVTPEQHEALKNYAQEESLTVNQLVREILKSFLMN